jgi:methionine aminotransferase
METNNTSTPAERLPRKHSGADMTIFSVMSMLAQECGAVNLSQGFPDYPIDARLMENLFEAARKGMNQYAPMAGLPALQLEICAHVTRQTGVACTPDQVTVTPGASYGIYTALATILQAGDEVIILEPAYDSYIPAIEVNGGTVVPVALQPGTFAPDWQLIADRISSKTKAIIVNTPHNPTGTVWSTADWEQLYQLIAGKQIYIISDEVYEQVIFDGVPHHSVWSHEGLREHCFAIYSFGKALHNTGWKVGYVLAPADLSKAFRRIHQYLAFSVNTPAQGAVAAFMAQQQVNDSSLILEQKRNYFIELLKDLPFTIPYISKGSYFQLADYSAVSDLPDTEFAKWLTREAGVATIPISAFYRKGSDQRLIRFCFAKKEETLAEAVNRMKARLL